MGRRPDGVPDLHLGRAPVAVAAMVAGGAHEFNRDAGLDGLLLFKIEEMYWLTGYDCDGFVIFTSMFVGLDGELTLLARAAESGSLQIGGMKRWDYAPRSRNSVWLRINEH